MGIDYGEFLVITTNSRTLAILTNEQRLTVAKFASDYQNDATRMIVHRAGFELPEGYVTVTIYNDENLLLHGGIAPDGQAST
jgi:hypothetical protein